MLVEIVKPFPFSRDGITEERATAGNPADIPDHLIPGLKREGYVRETKALSGAPQNKVEPALENKAEPEPKADADADAEPKAKTATTAKAGKA